MPAPVNVPAAGVGTAVTVTTTAETVAATLNGVNADNLETQVNLEANLDITIGTGGVTLTVKFERGTAAGGTTVSKGATWGPFTVVAANRVNINAAAVDTPGNVAGQSYVVTVTVGSASGNSTVNTATLTAIVAPAS